MARTRKRQEIAPAGVIIRDQPSGAQAYPDQPGIGKIEECADEERSPGKDHGFRLEKKFSNFEPLTGEHRFPNTQIKVLALNARPTVYSTPGPPTSSVLPVPPSNNILATQVLSRSNPSKADVDLGVTLAELREAPQLVYKAGRSLLQNGANYWLYYNFGWRPLVNDLLDLLDVPSKVEQRIVHLERAAQKGGMRRRVQLQSQQGPVQIGSSTIESRGGLVLKCATRGTSKRKIWGTVRWKPSPIPGRFPRSDAARLSAARRAAYGLTFDPSTAWELIPWSWLIDYFGTMGDVLSATRNTVGLIPGSVCIMKTTEYKVSYTHRTDTYGITGGTGSKNSVLKERAVVPFVMPEAFQPLLNPGQLSNLAALGVNRIPKDLLRQISLPGGLHL